jgi:hypothetical protein
MASRIEILRNSAMTESLMNQLVERPQSLGPRNGTTDDPNKMLHAIKGRVLQPEARVIPVDKLEEEDVEIPGPLFHTHRHHAKFAGHEQFEVAGKPMTIINLKGEGMYKTKNEIMNHLKRVGRFETVTCASYFVVGATDVNDAIASVQKYARKNQETFFNCSSASSASGYRYAPYGGRAMHKTKGKGKGKRKGKSQKRKFSRKMI